MKIIFLDVDGVLNSNKFYSKRGAPDYRFDEEPPYPICEFDPESVKLLNQITDSTNAKIVISSTWRIGRTVEKLVELGKKVNITGEIIDKTKTIRERKEYGNLVRGTEIRMWLEENDKVTQYIIIDDDNDMLPNQQPNFIKTSFWTGITIENVNLAIKILNKKG